MEGAVRLFVEILQFLWPFRPVEHWERGIYYVLGRARSQVGPGRWPVVPYFMDVRAVSMVPAPIIGPIQRVTLLDGRKLAYSASVVAQVEDPFLAVNAVDQYQESTMELLQSVVAAKLAENDSDRLTPEKRGRFLAALGQAMDRKTSEYGVRCRDLAFTNFVLDVPTLALIGGDSVSGW